MMTLKVSVVNFAPFITNYYQKVINVLHSKFIKLKIKNVPKIAIVLILRH